MQVFLRDFSQEVTFKVASVPPNPALDGSLIGDPDEETVRSNVMTPAPESTGVLVALNPTDEGRIGTGRNTREKKEYPWIKREVFGLPIFGSKSQRML
jgi:hypothetical protein